MTDTATKPAFTEWLLTQRHRKDGVGALAAHVAADSGWPKEASYRELIGYLVRPEVTKLEDLDEIIHRLRQAHFEWRQFTKTSGSDKK